MAKTKYPDVYVGNRGHYYYLVELDHDLLTGKRTQKRSRRDANSNRFRSAHDAYKEYSEIRNEYQSQSGYANYGLLYSDFMKNYYIPSYQSDIERSTFKSRQSTLKHLIGWFEQYRLRNIRSIDCEGFRVCLLDRSRYSQGFSSVVYSTFRNTSGCAVRMDFLAKNPSRKTEAISKGKSNATSWTKSKFEKVLSVIYTKDYYQYICFTILYLYFTCGMRVNEGLALTYDDVDYKRYRLRIHKTLDMTNKERYTVRPYAKTINGIRTISLDSGTIRVLKSWQKDQQAHGVYHFITSYDDIPMSRTTIPLVIRRFAKIAGVKPIQARGLRHSNISYLINEFNANMLTISGRLGHSGPDITLKYYSHLRPRNDESIADKMEGNIVFKNAKEDKLAFNGN